MRKRKYAQGYINDENMQDIKGKSSFRSEGTKSKWAHKNEYKAQEHIVTRLDFAGKLVASVRYGLLPHPPLRKTMNKRRSAFQK